MTKTMKDVEALARAVGELVSHPDVQEMDLHTDEAPSAVVPGIWVPRTVFGAVFEAFTGQPMPPVSEEQEVQSK